MTKRTKIIIASVAALIVIIAAGVFTSVSLTKQADEAATTYRKDVLAKAEAIREGPTMVDRAKLIKEPIELKDVFLGSQLSSKYRDAEALQKRYTTLISETRTFFEEASTFEEVVTTVTDFTALVKSATPIPSEQTEANISKVEGQAKKFGEIADSFNSYTFAPQYESDRKTGVENLKEAQKKFEEIATLLKTKQGNLKPEIQTIATSYGKVYGEIREFIVGPVTDSAKDQASRLPDESKEVDGKFKSFIDDLK